MKKIFSLNQVAEVINRKEDFYHNVNGKACKLDFIRVLRMPLIDVLGMIENENLFYIPEC